MNFYDDDVITVTSFVLRTQSASAVFCPAVFFCNLQVLNSIVVVVAQTISSAP